MNDSLRESLSYFGLYKKMFRVQRNIMSDKIIIWVHGDACDEEVKRPSNS